MKILVTGAGGFIGKNLTESLRNLQSGKDRTRPGLVIEQVYACGSDCSDEKLEDKITRCAYVEIFEHYGIRNFAKVFCNADLCMAVMHRHTKFVRHSDLVDGECCHDKIIRI